MLVLLLVFRGDGFSGTAGALGGGAGLVTLLAGAGLGLSGEGLARAKDRVIWPRTYVPDRFTSICRWKLRLLHGGRLLVSASAEWVTLQISTAALGLISGRKH